jgi:hypothetical protein
MIWLRTDERKEAVNSLEKAYQFILEVHNDPYNWKWVIIAIHNATQAFMVLALQGPASLNVIKIEKNGLRQYNWEISIQSTSTC